MHIYFAETRLNQFSSRPIRVLVSADEMTSCLQIATSFSESLLKATQILRAKQGIGGIPTKLDFQILVLEKFEIDTTFPLFVLGLSKGHFPPSTPDT